MRAGLLRAIFVRTSDVISLIAGLLEHVHDIVGGFLLSYLIVVSVSFGCALVPRRSGAE